MRSALNILVVDDDSAVRAAPAGFLDDMGYRVIEASGAGWALELFDGHRPDLVLLDLEMPEHDGYGLARQVRARETGRWTRIIFLSAHAADADLAEGIESGGDDCLREVGAMFRQICRRPGDETARHGGEEFALILPHTPESGAMTMARAIQRVGEGRRRLGGTLVQPGIAPIAAEAIASIAIVAASRVAMRRRKAGSEVMGIACGSRLWCERVP